MQRNRYSVSKQSNSDEATLVKSTAAEIPSEQLKKLTVEEETMDESKLRELIYSSDSEEEEHESAEENDPKIEADEYSNVIVCTSPPIEASVKEQAADKALTTSEKLKQIAKENEVLAKKILAQNKMPKKIVEPVLNKVSSSAAINRKKAQWNIDRNNQILYKKIQAAKPSGLSIRKGTTLCRQTKLTA